MKKINNLLSLCFLFTLVMCKEEAVNLKINEQGCVVTKTSLIGSFTETYQYDERGNFTEIVLQNASSISKTQLFYDLKGKVSTSVNYQNNSNSPSQKISYFYEEKGGVLSSLLYNYSDYDLYQFKFTYDNQNRLEKILYFIQASGSAINSLEYIRFQYDDTNNTIKGFSKLRNASETLDVTLLLDSTKANPFYLSNLAYYFFFSGAANSDGNLAVFYLSKFRCKQIISRFSGTTNFTYVDNEQGFPIQMIAKGGLNYATTYEYNCNASK